MGTVLGRDIECEVIKVLPFGALNGCARACRAWSDYMRRADHSHYRILREVRHIRYQGITWLEYPNGKKDGTLLAATNHGDTYTVTYARGVAIDWVVNTHNSKTYGRFDSNVVIYHNLRRLHDVTISYDGFTVKIWNRSERFGSELSHPHVILRGEAPYKISITAFVRAPEHGDDALLEWVDRELDMIMTHYPEYSSAMSRTKISLRPLQVRELLNIVKRAEK